MGLKDLEIVRRNELVKDYVLPKRVVWQGDGVTNADCLLTSVCDQASQGDKPVLTATTKGGKKGAFLLDFGTELTGGIRFITNVGCWGQTVEVRVRFGETVAEAMTPLGEKKSDNSHAARDIIVPATVLSKGEWGETAFRFVYLELLSPEADLEFVSVHAVFTYRDMPYLGSFSCNDERINEIYNTAAYTAHLCMQHYVWDGAKRDRLVWCGDLYWGQFAIRAVFGDQKVVDASWYNVTQANKLPGYPNFMPAAGMSYILGLSDWYFYTGRKDLVKNLQFYWLPLLKQLCGLVQENAPHLTKDNIPDTFFYDWNTEGNDEATLGGMHAKLTETLTSGIRLCEAVGETELAALCAHKAALLQENNNRHFDIHALASHMYRAGQLSCAATAAVLKQESPAALSGAQGFGVLKAMAETVSVEFALSAMREFYGAMLSVGSTTFWEYFRTDWVRGDSRIDKVLSEGEYDIHGDNGAFCYGGHRNSLCHIWSSAPVAFLAENVLGIKILAPGCKKIAVCPDLGDLDWAKGTYPTPYGLVSVSVERVGGELVTQVFAPAGIDIIKD